MQNLEKRILSDQFFDRRYGGYVLDDELISSKAQ
jgi:hypothetical protein